MFNTVFLWFEGGSVVRRKLNGIEPWDPKALSALDKANRTPEARYSFLAFLQSKRHCALWPEFTFGHRLDWERPTSPERHVMSRCHHNQEVLKQESFEGNFVLVNDCCFRSRLFIA